MLRKSEAYFAFFPWHVKNIMYPIAARAEPAMVETARRPLRSDHQAVRRVTEVGKGQRPASEKKVEVSRSPTKAHTKGGTVSSWVLTVLSLKVATMAGVK